MRLQQLSPPLNAHFVDTLASIGIKTEFELLLASDPDELFRRLPADHGISLRDFRAHLVHATALATAPAVRGDELLAQETKRRAARREQMAGDPDVSVGVPALDALVGGGFAPPRVVEVSGVAGSGKTALALQLALRHLAHAPLSGALWIDTSGDFAPERVETVLGQIGGPHAATALERLQVSLAFDIDAAHEVLDILRRELTTHAFGNGGSEGEQPEKPSSAWDDPPPPPRPATRIVVIDTVTALLAPLLSSTSSQGHAVMTTFMRQLRAFADSFDLTVLVINSTTRVAPRRPDATNPEAVFETTRKPALGPSFAFMADTTLWLSPRPEEEIEGEGGVGRGTVHVAEVMRSRVVRSKKWAKFEIQDGILMSSAT